MELAGPMDAEILIIEMNMAIDLLDSDNPILQQEGLDILQQLIAD